MSDFNDLTKNKNTVNPDEVSPELLDEISGGTNPEQEDSECNNFRCGTYSRPNERLE